VTHAFETDDGRTLTYDRRGTGPLLVCHPGGPGFSSRYFAGGLGGLDERFTLILFDPRGTAASTKPADARSYSTADYVADVEALRRHLGEEQLDLLGHSHGGVVAAAYAAAHPERVRRVILANSLARLLPEAMEAEMQTHADEPWYDAARAGLERESAGEYQNEEELREIVLSFMPMYFARYDDTARQYVERSLTERANPDALKVFNEGLEGWDVRSELAAITAPTLITTGARDFITGPACAQDLAAGIPHAKLVVVEGCGHFPFVECPDRWRKEVASFLA
jgi:proline-specific peptidase